MAKSKTALATLLPNATIVKGEGGEPDLIVPFDKNENATANKLVAAQLRQIIQQKMKMMKDGEIVMTPKELNDLAMAVRNLAFLSKDVYADAEPIQRPKSPADAEVKVEEVNFDKIGETDEKTDDN